MTRPRFLLNNALCYILKAPHEKMSVSHHLWPVKNLVRPADLIVNTEMVKFEELQGISRAGPVLRKFKISHTAQELNQSENAP